PYVILEDMPPAPSAIAAVEACGARLRERSRWLNAASFEATPPAIEAMRHLRGVQSIELVAHARSEPADTSPRHHHRSLDAQPLSQPPSTDGPGYGNSAHQLQLVRADALHDRGLYGLGVLVAHFDTGYGRLSHEAFRTLRVAGAHDFVDGDADPGN